MGKIQATFYIERICSLTNAVVRSQGTEKYVRE